MSQNVNLFLSTVIWYKNIIRNAMFWHEFWPRLHFLTNILLEYSAGINKFLRTTIESSWKFLRWNLQRRLTREARLSCFWEGWQRMVWRPFSSGVWAEVVCQGPHTTLTIVLKWNELVTFRSCFVCFDTTPFLSDLECVKLPDLRYSIGY